MDCYPDFDQFVKLAEHGNLIPVTLRILADFETPLSAYMKIRGNGESFLFESVEGGERLGRYSFVGNNPCAVIKQSGDKVIVREKGKTAEQYSVDAKCGSDNTQTVPDALYILERFMNRYRAVDVPSLPLFTGGAIGFLGYEFIHDIEPVVPKSDNDELQTPTLYFIVADQLLVFDRVSHTITLLANAVIDPETGPRKAYDAAVSKIRSLLEQLNKPVQSRHAFFPTKTPDIPITSNMPKERFMENVNRAKEYITNGDIIQIVGSQRFSMDTRSEPIDIYRAARTINPSPYMFLLELDGFSLVGASPEIHVRCEHRQVLIRPIAGTRPRGKTPSDDMQKEAELLADPKEKAEHVMLVDLARNDIGRVCEFGTVKVQNLMVIERYSHVMHIVSQVCGQLSESKTPYDLMRATFPAGTLSGAPKVRAMQIISELENTQRGPYGGCVGYFSFNGNLDCCITIRTALIKDGKAYVQAGGGWVHDSVPETEFQETVNKAKAMLKAVALAEGFNDI
ncbi:MAG: anthranilate synthase component I [Verrucomicrobia bacterium]|nr:anthranilate synthase component I [Verrucomicrobiota bacterium]